MGAFFCCFWCFSSRVGPFSCVLSPSPLFVLIGVFTLTLNRPFSPTAVSILPCCPSNTSCSLFHVRTKPQSEGKRSTSATHRSCVSQRNLLFSFFVRISRGKVRKRNQVDCGTPIGERQDCRPSSAQIVVSVSLSFVNTTTIVRDDCFRASLVFGKIRANTQKLPTKRAPLTRLESVKA